MTELPSLARARWLKTPALQGIFRAIEAAGGEARVAGGAVRNALLGIPVADIDLATTLPPEKVTEACRAAGMKVVATGLAHGTVTVIADHRPYEVTTLRHDVETDGRRAKVRFTGEWQEDALRRDFTMNALYCDARGKLFDYTNGYRDIRRKKVIFVGKPARRIGEDYLRILRFFRFHASFGKAAPDPAGLAACVRLRRGLDGLSAERIRQELCKLIVAPRAVETLKLMAAKGILGRILPYTEDWRTLGRLPPDPALRLFALAADPLALKESLRLSNREARRLEALSAWPPPTPGLRPKEQRIVLYHAGEEAWRDLVHLGFARARASAADARWRKLLRLPDRWQPPAFPVNGRDLQKAGIAAGPALGEHLRRLEDWWLVADFKPGKDELLARLNKDGGGNA